MTTTDGAVSAPPPPPPDDLRDAGAALWTALQEGSEFEADEAHVLAELCRQVDRLATIREALDAAPSLMVIGSAGQERAHPLLAEERAARLVFAKLQAQLAGARDADEYMTPSARRAALAARARWQGATYT